jgi:hypothetical protein
MCVGGESRTQRHRAFKSRLSCRQWSVLQNETTGVRGGIVEAIAAGEVLLIEAMSIMVRAMNREARGCVEPGRRSR